VKLKVAIRNPRIRSAVGAALAVLCGLILWGTALGERWANASYDYGFRFGERKAGKVFRFEKRQVTNELVLLLMQSDERPPTPWDRGAHAELVNRLADEKCPLVVFDVRFAEASTNNPKDVALLAALRRLDRVALMAKQARDDHPLLPSMRPLLPAPEFLAAAKDNWGVAWFDADLDGIVRKHWPFPDPVVSYPSLAWTVAKMAGASLSDEPRERWLRYYGFDGAWISLSYAQASNQVAGYFSDKIVFIGNKPQSPVPDGEEDEFSTPYTRWEKEACAGVYLVATAFLNLVNNDWLRRPPWAIEGALFSLTGIVLGAGLCRLPRLKAFGGATAAGLGVTLAGVTLSHATNFWVPWLVVAGGQLPCALIYAWITWPRGQWTIEDIVDAIPPEPRNAEAVLDEAVREIVDYDVMEPAFAHGAFGKVWVAQNAIGQWQALKTVYQLKFGTDRGPYDTEFRGIQNYKPISDKHPGLLRVDFVSKQKIEGYFYYVMELGDCITPGWEKDPATYRPRDLASLIEQAEHHRLPVLECIRILGQLAEALEFLHQQGYTHRDIKPSNIIFVNGRPKLADVGLVRHIRPLGEIKTVAGTIGYMPPHEPPGTVAADIYALGMVLYVISTGNKPAIFPELSSTLAQAEGPEFMRLNSVICKACDPNAQTRFTSAAELCAALAEVLKFCEKVSPPSRDST